MIFRSSSALQMPDPAVQLTAGGEQCAFRLERGGCKSRWPFDHYGRLPLLELAVQPVTGLCVSPMGITEQPASVRFLRLYRRRRGLGCLGMEGVHLLEALGEGNVRGAPGFAQQPCMLGAQLHPGLPTAQEPAHHSGTAGPQGPNSRAEQRGKSRIHDPAA
ncbi:hypothetical protein AB0I02_46505 [Streptomyces phaeochromogenes]